MNLPNILTLLRIFLTFFFIYFLYQRGLPAKITVLVVFILASLTDFFDGHFARKHNIITNFGKIMDPIADKFLMLSAFYVFASMHIIAFWMFVIIFIREVVVTVLRLMAMRRQITLAAEKAGKVKTVLQIIAVYLIIIFIIIAQFSVNAQWFANLLSLMILGIYGFMVVVVLITVTSGVSFIWNNRKEIFHVG